MTTISKCLLDVSFEEALGRLEKLVVSMEDGEISLAELVEQYEEGTGYLRVCQKHLRDAELKIEKLKKEHDSWETETFEPDTTTEDSL